MGINPAIAVELANGVEDMLRQGAAVATGNQGDWIANGTPASIWGKTQQATARQYCRRSVDRGLDYPGAAKVLIERACRPYLNSIGYGTAPTVAMPFRGGQCVGAVYRVVTTATVTFGFGTTTVRTNTFNNLTGPIRAVTPLVSGNAGQIRVTFGPEQGGGIFAGVIQTVAADASGPALRTNVLSITVTRTDGGQDSCGNLPVVVTPPAPPVGAPGPTPRVVPYNPSIDINLDIDLEVNVDASATVNFGTGPITIDPFGEEVAPVAPSLPPGDVGSPATPVDLPVGGAEEGVAPEGSVLVGLKIAVVDWPIGARQFAEGIFRGPCYIYMGTSEGLDQDYAGAMLRSGQFVFAEVDNLTHWRVSANVGYQLRVTPYYREVE